MEEKAITQKHCVTWKINNFSALTGEKYYSDTFIIGGFSWRMWISLKGKKNPDCLSIYLAAGDTGSLPYGWSRSACFSFAVINQIDETLSIWRELKHTFNSRAVSFGYRSFLPLDALHKGASEFLVDDTCIVGVKIWNEDAKSMVTEQDNKSESQEVPEKISVEATIVGDNKMEGTEDTRKKDKASSSRKERDNDEMSVSNEENLNEKGVTKKRRTTCGIPMDSLVQTKDLDEGFATLFEEIGRMVRGNPLNPNEAGILKCLALLKEASTKSFSDLPLDKRVELTSVFRVLSQNSAKLSPAQASSICSFSNQFEDLCQSCDSSIAGLKTTQEFLDSKDDCLNSLRRLDQSQLKIKGDIGIIKQEKEQLLKKFQKLEESESQLLSDYMAVGREAQEVKEKWDALIMKTDNMLQEREKATIQKARVESTWSGFISLFSSAASTERILNELVKEGTSSKGILHEGEMRKEKSIDNDILKGNEAVKGIASDVSAKRIEDKNFSNLSEPLFYNFEISDYLKSGQVWAVYDTIDAMPRRYARIRSVYPSSQKVKLTWLVAYGDNEDEIAWDNEGLPISCGRFVHGWTEEAEYRQMFSHLACWVKGSKTNTYVIYPRPGETWALFKNWDIKWKTDATAMKKFEYEFVEILSDYDESSGVRVAQLAKIKGFPGLFCRTMKEHSFRIPPDHVLSFSHQVPSVRMTGDEREDVPKGSFELDLASLPSNLEEIDLPDNSEPNTEMQNNGLFSKIQPDEGEPMESDKKASLYQNQEPDLNLKMEGHIPDPDFHDFDADRSIEKFEIGQIWAFYSDEDGLPKYYGQIKAISVDPVFEVLIRWLTSHSLPGNVSLWRNKGMPICCGNFKFKRGSSVASYDDSSIFSHQVRAETGDEKEFIVFPKAGEIWALYKQWNTDLTHEDIQNSEYEIVEIVKGNGSLWEVKVLERVDGFVSVFKAQESGSSQEVLDIPASQLLSFSHQIPAYKLTEERNGSLNGFWELDPLALPSYYF